MFLTIGPPSITSCRAIRTEGDTCLVALETDLEEAAVDCRANGAEVIKYEWRKHGLVLTANRWCVLIVVG